MIAYGGFATRTSDDTSTSCGEWGYITGVRWYGSNRAETTIRSEDWFNRKVRLNAEKATLVQCLLKWVPVPVPDDFKLTTTKFVRRTMISKSGWLTRTLKRRKQ